MVLAMSSVGGQMTRHSGASRSEEPGIYNPDTGDMDSGFAAARRPGMTEWVCSMHGDNRVIVSGCGPVGAVMTLALVKKGIPVTLIEQLPDAAEDQRAATIHAPT